MSSPPSRISLCSKRHVGTYTWQHPGHAYMAYETVNASLTRRSTGKGLSIPTVKRLLGEGSAFYDGSWLREVIYIIGANMR